MPVCRDPPRCWGSGEWAGEEEHQGHVHTKEEWIERSRASPWRPWGLQRLDVTHWWPLAAHCTMCWEEEWAAYCSVERRGGRKNKQTNIKHPGLCIISDYLSSTRLNKKFVAIGAGSTWTGLLESLSIVCSSEVAKPWFFACVWESVNASMRVEQESTCSSGITSNEAPQIGLSSGGTSFTAERRERDFLLCRC